MTKRKNQDKKNQKKIAEKRIKYLFSLAEKFALQNRLDLSDRYVEIARKISMKNLTSIPREYKKRYCKHCYKYLLPDKNCRIRIHKSRIIIYCFYCNKYTRIPLKNNKK